MILSKALSRNKKIVAPINAGSVTEGINLPELINTLGLATGSGQIVTPESSKNVATAYRCGNILSDDMAKLPLQVYISRQDGEIQRQHPDPFIRNLAWLTERKPNRWWTPFQFKKQKAQWLIHWGNAYVWQPPIYPREHFILPSNVTFPVFDLKGNLWYRTRFRGDHHDSYLPDVEVAHTLINPDETGFNGRGVVQYARETIGRQLSAYASQNSLFRNGLSAAGILWLAGDSEPKVRKKVREMYEEVMSGESNSGRIAILDKKVTQFQPVTMQPKDIQFLSLIQDNDIAVMNFFGMPSYKLNTGKQAYNSNEQNNNDYLSTTLDPYLVQDEQVGASKWLTEDEQGYMYLRYERSALFRTNAKDRGDYLNAAIQNMRMTPNEARQVEDRSASKDPAADKLYRNSASVPIDLPTGVKNA
jgi:HK97 family phage portal protein